MPAQVSSSRATEEWEQYVGAQFRTLRIRANLEQADLARRAVVSVKALRGLELGHGSTLKTLIKVSRALEQTDWLESLAPAITVSPMQLLRSQNKASPRQKVYRSRKPRTPKES